MKKKFKENIFNIFKPNSWVCSYLTQTWVEIAQHFEISEILISYDISNWWRMFFGQEHVQHTTAASYKTYILTQSVSLVSLPRSYPPTHV